MSRRHPLLSVENGSSIDEFSVDVLHTLHWIGSCALWLFMDFDLLDTRRRAKSQTLKETVSRIRRMLSVGNPFNNLIGSDGDRSTAAQSS